MGTGERSRFYTVLHSLLMPGLPVPDATLVVDTFHNEGTETKHQGNYSHTQQSHSKLRAGPATPQTERRRLVRRWARGWHYPARPNLTPGRCEYNEAHGADLFLEGRGIIFPPVKANST